jgi:anti-sigma factor RsiW
MNARAPHLKDELDELLDGRLEGSARLEAEKHLGQCEECGRQFTALRWIKMDRIFKRPFL